MTAIRTAVLPPQLANSPHRSPISANSAVEPPVAGIVVAPAHSPSDIETVPAALAKSPSWQEVGAVGMTGLVSCGGLALSIAGGGWLTIAIGSTVAVAAATLLVFWVARHIKQVRQRQRDTAFAVRQASSAVEAQPLPEGAVAVDASAVQSAVPFALPASTQPLGRASSAPLFHCVPAAPVGQRPLQRSASAPWLRLKHSSVGAVLPAAPALGGRGVSAPARLYGIAHGPVPDTVSVFQPVSPASTTDETHTPRSATPTPPLSGSIDGMEIEELTVLAPGGPGARIAPTEARSAPCGVVPLLDWLHSHSQAKIKLRVAFTTASKLPTSHWELNTRGFIGAKLQGLHGTTATVELDFPSRENARKDMTVQLEFSKPVTVAALGMSATLQRVVVDKGVIQAESNSRLLNAALRIKKMPVPLVAYSTLLEESATLLVPQCLANIFKMPSGKEVVIEAVECAFTGVRNAQRTSFTAVLTAENGSLGHVTLDHAAARATGQDRNAPSVVLKQPLAIAMETLDLKGWHISSQDTGEVLDANSDLFTFAP